MAFPNFFEERKLWAQGFKFVVGLDEAGRGPLAGPVVAGAVLISPKLKIRDSKQLSAKQREEAYKIITKHPAFKWGIGIVSEKVIDKINILEATKLAMVKSVENLLSKSFGHKIDGRQESDQGLFLLIDGNFKINASRLRQGFGEPKQKSIVRGDQKVISISAASIIAKVTRDRIMEKYDRKFPQYGFAKHKGYGTEFHRNKIKEIGFCKIHRKTFCVK
jgi:ribonuclease HII